MSNQNAAAYFVDRHAAEGRGDKPVFVEADGEQRSLTYGELAEQSDRMAGFFARHGIRREERVAVLVLDTVDFPVIFWGSLKAGVVPIAINNVLATDVYETILRDSRARALFVSAALLDVIRPLIGNIETLENVFVIGGGGHGHADFAAELAQSQPAPLP